MFLCFVKMQKRFKVKRRCRQAHIGTWRHLLSSFMAERVGFEPTYRLLTDNSISSRARYGHFATSPRCQPGLARGGVTF